MKKLSFKAVFIPTFTLFLVCVIITAALAFTNSITAEKIAENNAQAQQESMKTVCPDATSFELVEETDKGSIFEGKNDSGDIVGYAVSTSSSGYGGQIKVMTGIKDSKVINIDVYYNDDETPGLGKNTSNESFTKGFQGLVTEKNIKVSKDADGSDQQVDAVTSSTISSRAVVNAVNDACAIYNEKIVGGDQ